MSIEESKPVIGPAQQGQNEAGQEESKHPKQSALAFADFTTPPRQPVKRILFFIAPFLLLSLSAIFVVRQRAASLINPKVARATIAVPPLTDKSEVRAIWIVRYTMTSPEAIRDSVKRAKAAGITDLVVQVRGRGDAFYNSLWEPRAEELAKQPKDFDPLTLMCEEAHAEGIRIHTWINAYVITLFDRLPQLPEHQVYTHPEWLMVPKPLAAALYGVSPRSPQYLAKLRAHVKANRHIIEGLFASPAHPEVKDHLLKVVLDVVGKYNIDGVHFDYIRYPNTSFDYNRTTLERFRAELEPTLDLPSRVRLAQLAQTNPLVYANTFANRYTDFLRDQINETEAAIYQAVKARKPNLPVSAAVYSVPAEAKSYRLQDWQSWTQRGTLDIVCPMVYTPDTALYRKQLSAAMRGASGRMLWGGIGSWRQPVPETLDKIKVTRELGANGFILFSYDSAVQFSTLNPQKDYLERLREGLAVYSR